MPMCIGTDLIHLGLVNFIFRSYLHSDESENSFLVSLNSSSIRLDLMSSSAIQRMSYDELIYVPWIMNIK